MLEVDIVIKIILLLFSVIFLYVIPIYLSFVLDPLVIYHSPKKESYLDRVFKVSKVYFKSSFLIIGSIILFITINSSIDEISFKLVLFSIIFYFIFIMLMRINSIFCHKKEISYQNYIKHKERVLNFVYSFVMGVSFFISLFLYLYAFNFSQIPEYSLSFTSFEVLKLIITYYLSCFSASFLGEGILYLSHKKLDKNKFYNK